MSGETAPLETACWTVLAPVASGGSVLWVGPAHGDQIARLSLIFGEVSTVNPMDALSLPESWAGLAVPEASVDLAVLPGVLADVKGWGPGARPRQAWESLLRAVHTRLKPGGHVFWAAENRWAFPRASGTGAGRRPVLVSVGGCRALLAKSGFSAIRMWCAFPDCEDPKFLVECRQPVFDYFLRVLAPRPRSAERRLVRGALNAVGVLKYTARWYWILGRRSAPSG